MLGTGLFVQCCRTYGLEASAKRQALCSSQQQHRGTQSGTRPEVQLPVLLTDLQPHNYDVIYLPHPRRAPAQLLQECGEVAI